MAQFQINTEQATAIATQIRAIQEDIEAARKEMRSTGIEESSWKGDARKEFDNVVAECNSFFDGIIANIEGDYKCLMDIIGLYTDSDNQMFHEGTALIADTNEHKFNKNWDTAL